jgi:hypothetical protein
MRVRADEEKELAITSPCHHLSSNVRLCLPDDDLCTFGQKFGGVKVGVSQVSLASVYKGPEVDAEGSSGDMGASTVLGARHGSRTACHKPPVQCIWGVRHVHRPNCAAHFGFPEPGGRDGEVSPAALGSRRRDYGFFVQGNG